VEAHSDWTERGCIDMATIYANGRMHTMGPSDAVVEAMLVTNGVVAAVGSTKDICDLAPRGAGRVDLGGKVVIPGLTDSHTHFLMFSLGLNHGVLDGASSRAERPTRCPT